MAIKTVAVVLPTIRKESIPAFLDAWQPLFKGRVEFIVVDDTGDAPQVIHNGEKKELQSELVGNKCAGVRQLGFLYIAQNLPDIEYIFTTDDDCFPIGDPIQDHIDQLNRKVPISWLSTSTDMYMRGFPYRVREEAPVMLSHGVWDGVPDYDAPTQLLTPKDFKPTYYKGVVPKGVFFPCCGMNLAFRREALPYIYFAPVGQFKGCERADDIWGLLPTITDFAKLNWGIVTGYARVQHLRASNVFTSMEKEAVGIRHNEEFWKDLDGYKGDPWFDEFREKRERWYMLMTKTEIDNDKL
jgi:reversibly glycosylated polypeptide/UDP-arabinopyranose mutase